MKQDYVVPEFYIAADLADAICTSEPDNYGSWMGDQWFAGGEVQE